MTKKTAFKVIFNHRGEITKQDVRDMIFSGIHSGNPRLDELQSTIDTYSVEEAENRV